MKLSRWYVALVFNVFVFCSSHNAHAEGFTLSSPQMKNGQPPALAQILNGFGCTGQNMSPALQWDNPPPDAKSFAVTLYDPDAPTGSGWWHWVVFNIPGETRSLAEGAGDLTTNLAPEGSLQSMTDFGKPGYGGPCPPAGDTPHRYIFTVYALDIDNIPLDVSAPAAMVGFYLHRHALGQAKFVTEYMR